MKTLIIAAVAAAVAIGVTPLIAAEPATADPAGPCIGPFPWMANSNCPGGPPHPAQAPAPGRVQTPRPVQTPRVNPPTYAPPRVTPVQTPQAPPPPPPPKAMAVQTPKINPPPPGAPRSAAVVTPAKGLEAAPAAVAAAKAAPAARIDPATPPKPPTQTDFNQQVQSVVNAHSSNVDLVTAGNQALARPRHWDYVDYDIYHRPILYNPITEAMTFRYFYDGAFRDVYVPAGGRIVLDVAAAGVFPFTAVADNYLASGYFDGGAWIPPDGWDGPPPLDYTPPPDPTVYQDVLADVPADDQTVDVGQVTVVGHDASAPAGSQDTFMLDGSTLAWGQVNDPGNAAQITVTKTQSLPGVGPTDNGSFLVALAAHEQPTHPWWPWALGATVLVAAIGLFTWVVIRRRRSAYLTVGHDE